ncbi:MAG: type IV pilus biogenesis/stability protein PilW [Gammaproteobacteria bacterium]|nr:type IV pilus biogenesis/stability protein PilW [Gammaproteobacteria bacterium]
MSGHVTRCLGVCLAALLLLGGCATSGGITSVDDGIDYKRPDIKPRPAAAEPNALLGIEYMKAGQDAQAMEHLQRALVHDPNLAVAHNGIAVLYEKLGQDEKAEAHFRRVVEISPNDSDAWNNYGRFLCSNQRYEESTRAFERALANPLYKTPQNTLTNLGVCALRDGQRELAENYFRQALAKAPNFVPALYQMASLSWESGNALQARAYLQRLTRLVRPNAAMLWLGVQVERELGDRGAAENYARQLRERFPTAPETRLLLATEKR